MTTYSMLPFSERKIISEKVYMYLIVCAKEKEKIQQKPKRFVTNW